MKSLNSDIPDTDALMQRQFVDSGTFPENRSPNSAHDVHCSLLGVDSYDLIAPLYEKVKKILAAALLVVLLASPSYATVVCGTADDTPAIQAALDATGIAELPAGHCKVSSINATNRFGPTIVGKGKFVSSLDPIMSGVAVIDCTGSSNCEIRDLNIDGAVFPNVIPAIGILNAQMAGSAACDVVGIDRVRVDGFFSLAAWYNLSCSSSHASYSQFYNYSCGNITAIHTGNNFFGATSRFVAIGNADTTPTDWTMIGNEFHNFCQSGNNPPSGGTGWTLWLGGTASYRFYGGNMSSSHAIVSINAVMTTRGQMNAADIIMDGTTFYSDFAPNAPCAVSGQSGAVAFRQNFFGMPPTGC